MVKLKNLSWTPDSGVYMVIARHPTSWTRSNESSSMLYALLDLGAREYSHKKIWLSGR